MKIALKILSARQEQAWIMRYRYGWRLKRIALKMGITKGSVSKLLLRASARRGLPRCHNVRIIRTKPRLATVVSLSDVFDV